MDGATEVPSRMALRQRIDSELKAGWDLHVAVLEERVVGLLALHPAGGMLDQIFVLPGQQRRGMGSALLELAKRIMPSSFKLRMPASNEGAKRFYEKEGLRLVGQGTHPRTGVPVLFYAWTAGGVDQTA